mgnify:CR=1 FL=1
MGCRRMLVKDKKMQEFIPNLIQNKEEFYIYEESDAQRRLKSASSRKNMRELKKLKAKQVAKGEKLKRDKLMEKEMKVKKRHMKAMVKQQVDDETNDRHLNRRKNKGLDRRYSNGL